MFDLGSATVSMSTKATMKFFVTSLDVLVKCAQSIGKAFMLSSCYTQDLVFSSSESLPLDQASDACWARTDFRSGLRGLFFSREQENQWPTFNFSFMRTSAPFKAANCVRTRMHIVSEILRGHLLVKKGHYTPTPIYVVINIQLRMKTSTKHSFSK